MEPLFIPNSWKKIVFWIIKSNVGGIFIILSSYRWNWCSCCCWCCYNNNYSEDVFIWHPRKIKLVLDWCQDSGTGNKLIPLWPSSTTWKVVWDSPPPLSFPLFRGIRGYIRSFQPYTKHQEKIGGTLTPTNFSKKELAPKAS